MHAGARCQFYTLPINQCFAAISPGIPCERCSRSKGILWDVSIWSSLRTELLKDYLEYRGNTFLDVLTSCRKLGCPEGRSASAWVDYSLFGHQIVCHEIKGYNATSTANAGMWLPSLPSSAPWTGKLIAIGNLIKEMYECSGRRSSASTALWLGTGSGPVS